MVPKSYSSMVWGLRSSLVACASRAAVRLHVVGGYVRDALLGREVRDTDLILSGRAAPFLAEISRRLGRRVVTFRKRGITDHRLQMLYGFTVGGPIDDSRLVTRPAYFHLEEEASGSA